MTSLASQLQNLQTAAARHLTVEKRHVSLLFDRTDAGKLTNETAFRIGVAGLEQMKRIDPVFDTEIANDLFTEERVNFVRSMQEKAENEILNQKIEKLLFELSPYLQHFACQQVLEFLIHTYHIYAYNAESLIIMFLPFHETKVYSRILKILDFDWERSKEWQFLKQFLKAETPIPFTSIVKATMSGSHSIVTRITDHINKGIELVGSEFLEVKHPVLFNFHAKILLALLDDPEKVDEVMLSKLMPFIENGIKSNLPSFRFCALMVVCQLCLVVKLKEDVLNSICKLLITKIRESTATTSISTLLVVFQQQNVEKLSRKTLLKFLQKDGDFEVLEILKELRRKTDTTKFFEVFWRELFGLIGSEDQELAEQALITTTDDPGVLTRSQAEGFIRLVFEEAVEQGKYLKNRKFLENLNGICVKFAREFDKVNNEFTSKNEKLTKKLIKDYNLENAVQFAHDIEIDGIIETTGNVGIDEVDGPSTKISKTLSAAEKAKELAKSSEFAKREVFSGDPIRQAMEWLNKETWNKVEWALNELTTRGAKYFEKKNVEDVENLFLKFVKLIGVENNKSLDGGLVKTAFSLAKLRPEFIKNLLTKVDDDFGETLPKKAKGPAVVNSVKKVFGDEESAENFMKRAVFVLEVLNARQSVPFNSDVLKALFGIVKDVCSRNDIETLGYQQHLAINCIRKIFENPGKTVVNANDVDMDCVIEAMRSTHNHHILRDCLRLIVAAARFAPNSVAKHVMSVFTFMGNGMLRKDNELTLSTVEKTVESLFKSIDSSNKKETTAKYEQNLKFVELARLFAASATDIPAHRRGRIAQAISRAVGAQNAATVVMVLVSEFCARWQRSTDAAAQEAAKRGSEQDAYDDLAIELLGALSPFEQLSSVLEMCEFVLRLGGDRQTGDRQKLAGGKKTLDELIFDRSTQTLPKIRHLRYVIVTLISRIFSNRTLIERLAAYNDDELLSNALPLGKRLIECSVELDEFANKEANSQDGNDPQAQRYWVAFASRTEVVSERLRHLLPGGVAARLIADVLKGCASETKISYKMCEKVLQLANIKLGHDGYLFADSGINEKELIALAEVLNKFIVPENRNVDKIRLCQNSAYTLKLIAKNLTSQSESKVLSETMQKCVGIVQQYQKLDDNLTGNVLLLAGELIRSHNISSTIHHAIKLLRTCLATVEECISKSQFDVNTPSPAQVKGTRGQRIRQQSLGGLKFGTDTLLICSLTCIQRVFDQFSAFVVEYSGDVVMRYCKLIARFGDPMEIQINQPSSSQGLGGSQTSGIGHKTGIHHRLALIRRALLTVEMRVMPAHFSKCVRELKGDKKSLSALFNLMSGFVEAQQGAKGDGLRKSVVQLRESIVEEIILPALEYRSEQKLVENFEHAERLEATIYNFIVSMASVLSEVEFKPMVNALVKWAEPGLEVKAEQKQKVRLVSVLHFANYLYEAFNSLALPYFGRMLEISVLVLKKCNVTLMGADEVLMTGKRGSIEALETNMALTMAIDLISNSARHKDFFTSDRCQMVTNVLIDEIVNTKAEGHEKRCSEHLVTAIYRVGNADPDNFSELLNKMLLKTRDSRAKIRYRTLMVLELLIEKVGDGIQPHLSLLLPFLNELIEDENKQVEIQCQKVISALQHKFGETFWSNSSA